MTMTVTELIIVGFMIMLGTMITRFLPFLMFPADKPTPRYVRYLGKVLPAAVLGMLIIYCLKDVNVLTGSRGMPEFISMAAVVLLHLRQRQMLISIATGTILYMVLIQFVF